MFYYSPPHPPPHTLKRMCGTTQLGLTYLVWPDLKLLYDLKELPNGGGGWEQRDSIAIDRKLALHIVDLGFDPLHPI